jgi:hypothetical protein
LGREINSAAQHKQKSMGSPVCLVQFKILLFAVSFLLCVARSIAVKDKIKANKKKLKTDKKTNERERKFKTDKKTNEIERKFD